MCGLAGFAGVHDPVQRRTLVRELGLGIDTRGRHAAGYTTVTTDGRVRYGRMIGEWSRARERFIAAASAGPTALLHARYATMNNAHDVTCAHPFAVRREGRTVLWGAHNGTCSDAAESAYVNSRPYTVDSLEVLELLADQRNDDISNLEGWGTLAWIAADDPHTVRIVRMSDYADLYVVKTVCGAVVFGSTEAIVGAALRKAGMTAESYYTLLEEGTVYAVRAGGLAATGEPAVKFAEQKWRRKWAQIANATRTGHTYNHTYNRDVWDTEFQISLETDPTDPNDGEPNEATWADELRNRYRDENDVDVTVETGETDDETDETDETDDDRWWRDASEASDFDRAALLRRMVKKGMLKGAL